MSGICERGFMLMIKKFGILGALSELLEPHLFGRTGALKFGTIGVHLCGLLYFLSFYVRKLNISPEPTGQHDRVVLG